MKTKSVIFSIMLVAISAIVLNACKKDVNPTYPSAPAPAVVTVPVGNYPAGLGSSPGTPVCKPFVLPSNIVLLGQIQSASFKSTGFNKENQNIEDFIFNPKTTSVSIGSGSLVQFYMKFFNKSPLPTTFIIPGGLMFLPEDTTTQTGTTVQPDTLIIPGNDSVLCYVRTYCTNLHKHTPNNTKYKMLGTTLHNDLWTMVDILKNKKKLDQGSQVQSIIWNITDHGGLTDADRIYLNNLP